MGTGSALSCVFSFCCFFFQAEDGIRDVAVTGVQTCALPISNLYTNSIVALDAKTGKFLGYIQTSKNDYHDWDVSAAPSLFTTRGGRKMMVVPGKDGLLHGILRRGNAFTLRYSVPTTTRSNVNAPLTHLRATRFCPGTQGGTEWNGAAFHPALNMVYVGAVDWCANIKLVHPDSIKLP